MYERVKQEEGAERQEHSGKRGGMMPAACGGVDGGVAGEERNGFNGLYGLVFDIQRFSLHDGPGIRTTVFLKGCPLRCAWCHNPESQAREAELAFHPERCMGCGSCVSACPRGCHELSGTREVGNRQHGATDDSSDVEDEGGVVHDADEGGDTRNRRHEIRRADCTACGACAQACSTNALTIVGRMMPVDEVIGEVLADSLFYGVSGGGMTVSGGEPMAQPAFTLALLKAAKAHNLHTCLDTCGYGDPDALAQAVPLTDLFLFDLKATAEEHARWTGVPLGPILRSLRAIDDAGGKIILRCPLIPGVNLHDAHLESVAGIAASIGNLIGIELVPYHPVGLAKRDAVGRTAARLLRDRTGTTDGAAAFAEPVCGACACLEMKPLAMSEAATWAEKLQQLARVPVTVV